MRPVAITILFLASCLGTSTGIADGVEISEWAVPYQHSRPRDPFVDSLGRVWFCGQAGGYLAYLEPESGEFKKYPLAEGGSPNRLVEFDIAKQAFDTVIDVPNAGGSIRHMYFDDGRQSIWFGEDTNFIGRLRIP